MRRAAALAVLLVTVSFVGCTGGGDGDSLPADAESQGWSVSVTYANGTERTYQVTSDPTQTDTDSDGLDDFQELDRGSDPRDIDTDDDRLLDGSTQCPESGSALAQSVHENEILEHPERSGCYLGESRTEIGEMSYTTSALDAHSDSSPQLSDHLADGTEIVGWDVQPAAGEAYHVRSNPGLRQADTDSDGLHDGLEKRLTTDPKAKDTDADGVNDYNDAAPLGDLKVTVHVLSMNLKQDYKVTGGADLVVDVTAGQTEASKGPQSIDKGDNQLDWSLDLDVSDQGSGFTEELGGAYAKGNWEKEIRLRFTHGSGDGEPIQVRSDGGENGHFLVLSYDAFEERWTGHASGGTSSGPDADVTIDVTTRVE